MKGNLKFRLQLTVQKIMPLPKSKLRRDFTYVYVGFKALLIQDFFLLLSLSEFAEVKLLPEGLYPALDSLLDTFNNNKHWII